MVNPVLNEPNYATRELGTNRKMSDKSSFERLISQDRRFQVFNDTVPAGIMVLRVDDGKVLFTNRYFNDILGHDGSEILGASWTDFFADAE